MKIHSHFLFLFFLSTSFFIFLFYENSLGAENRGDSGDSGDHGERSTSLLDDETVCPDLVREYDSTVAQENFLTNYNDSEFSTRTDDLLRDKIDDTSFIFVTGFLSNLQMLTGEKNFDDITRGMRKFCREQDCRFDYRHSYNFHMNTSSSSQENALVVKRMIESIWDKEGRDRDIVLVGHSKGGIDITQALVDMMPDLTEEDLDHIRVITISTPYGGSPLANGLLKESYSKKISSLILKVTGGSLASLKDLTVERREKFLHENCDKLQELSNHYLSVGENYSYGDEDERDEGDKGDKGRAINPGKIYSRMLIPFKKELDKSDPVNDGFVLLKDQRFGRFIQLPEESDHIGLVMPSEYPPSIGVVQVFKILVMMIPN